MYFTSFECPTTSLSLIQQKLAEAEISFVVETNSGISFFQLTHSCKNALGTLLSTLSDVHDIKTEVLNLDAIDDGWSEDSLEGLKFRSLRIKVLGEGDLLRLKKPQSHLCLSNSQEVFGDGCHETTRLFLKYLESNFTYSDLQTKGHNVLDLGCGNGVLGLALLYLLKGKTNAQRVRLLGVDICQKATQLAANTARVNGFESLSEFATSLPHDRRFDLILCNIQPPFVFDLLSYIADHLENPAAQVVLSGFTRFDKGLLYYKLAQHQLEVIDEVESRGWFVCSCKKRRLSKGP